jgi:hypothetical protein
MIRRAGARGPLEREARALSRADRRPCPCSDRPGRRLPIRPRRDGATLVVLAFTIVVFALFAALTVDVGYWYYQQAKLQGVLDIAAVSSLGTMADRQPVALQKTHITNQLRLMAQGNGYPAGIFIPTFTTTTTNVFGTSQEVVQTITVNTSLTVETFFWQIMNVGSIRIAARAAAERLNFAPPGGGQLADGSCLGFVALGNFNMDSASSVDSFDSRFGAYSPTNAAPSGGTRRYHRGNAVIHANGNLTKVPASAAIDYYGYLRVDGTMDLRDSYLSRKGLASGTVGERDGALTTDGSTIVVGTIDAASTVNDLTMELPIAPSTSAGDYSNSLITKDAAVTLNMVNVAAGDLNVTGGSGNIYIPAGRRYRFTRFNTNNINVRVRVTGSTTAAAPTQIWWAGTAGTMTIAGGMTMDSGEATDLAILNTGTRPIAWTVRRFTGASSTNINAGQIISPGGNVTIQTNNGGLGAAATYFVGQVVGAQITLTSANSLHRFVYDEALGCANGLQSNAPSGVSVDVHLIE